MSHLLPPLSGPNFLLKHPKLFWQERAAGQVLPSLHSSECCDWSQMEVEICRFESSVSTWTEGFRSIPFPLSKTPWNQFFQNCLNVPEGPFTEVRNFWAFGWWWLCHGLDLMEHQFVQLECFEPIGVPWYFNLCQCHLESKTGSKVCFWWDVLPTSGSSWPLVSCFLLHVWI